MVAAYFVAFIGGSLVAWAIPEIVGRWQARQRRLERIARERND